MRVRKMREFGSMKIIDDIRKAIDNRQVTILTLLDFSKAFQFVDHDIRLAKLEHNFNFAKHTVQWVHSYLTDRKQAVLSNSSCSE